MKPFLVHEPVEDSPVLVEVPHAGLQLDAQTMAYTAVPVRCLGRDADLYVDELFADAPAVGATLLCAQVSRYAVDLNRHKDDYDGQAVTGGASNQKPRGVIWRLSSDGLPVLTERLPRPEYERRIAGYWKPYHDAVAELLMRKRDSFGFAVMLCAHSMPTPRSRGRRLPPSHDPEIVPGTRGRTSAHDSYINLVDEKARSFDWEVMHDMPYRGGYSTGHYGRPGAGPSKGIHVVQLEIARRLYMDEARLSQEPDGFAKVRRFARELVTALVEQSQRWVSEG